VVSIVSSLGFGSGIDIPKLVSDLAAASREPKIARLDARTQAVRSSISAVGAARSALESFSRSFDEVVAGGTLQTQPTVSDATVIGASAKPGARLGNFSGSVEVTALAQGQTSVSAYLAAGSAPTGQGTLRIVTGTGSFDIVVDSANDSLDGLAAAITASGSGVTASVVTDGAGARLLLKGSTGAAAAFTVMQIAGDPALDRFATAQLTAVRTAQDAALTIDGLAYTRPTNRIDDLLPGVTLTLKKAAPGVPVALGIERPAAALKSMLADFLSVFNELKAEVSNARKATGNDANLRMLDRQLSGLLAQSVTSYSGPARLADIGIRTNRDGSIAVDAAAFDRAFAANPDAVEAMFSPTRDATHTAVTDPGVAGALAALKSAATASTGTLASVATRLGKEADALAKDRERVEARETAYRARLEAQFNGLDARIGSLKATQSYLDQQVRMWTASDR
jgi:flagellar hook-associated protein 2